MRVQFTLPLGWSRFLARCIAVEAPGFRPGECDALQIRGFGPGACNRGL